MVKCLQHGCNETICGCYLERQKPHAAPEASQQSDVVHHRLVRAPRASVENTLLEPLAQLLTVTWDGNLMSKDARDRLVKCGLAERAHGYNWLTNKGIQYLVDLGALVP